ncbi:LPS export ABC transporter permease LptG [Rhizobium sp. SSA_523]|uniref:LPS export ABC transporter permease LptG n=1 Tax=Rhizobium sp. SSA_523 TaxID=2952477 RepID=UPI002090F226|nr:LPS export ABC transporter permease LptG [Rhizobium sp. SSA_523]MCO5730760.1 LPS export ABC transporter permease LptG [Rhizobium sp. SSA_523]WKC24416.1 LPS export ABC transporter permease LptG [Rhizobium sp. SSA_523]
MIPQTLSRYFFKRYMLTALWFFIGVCGIIFLADFSETSRRMSNFVGYTVTGGLLMSLLRLPLIFQQTVPTLTLFIGMTTLIALNRRSELVVTRAAGLSVWQFIMPFVFGAFLIGVFASFVVNPLGAWGQTVASNMETDWRKASNATKPSNFLPWIRQISGENDTIIGAKNFEEGGRELFNVVLFHFNENGRITLRQDAASATLEDGYWDLKDVLETRADAPPARKPAAEVPTNVRPEFLQESITRPESVAFFSILRKIEAARTFGISTKALETQFHSLLSLPLLLVAMTLIAATVSLRFSRMAQSRSVILGGIVSGFVLYVVTVLVKAFGSSGVVPPIVAVWIPVVVAMALGATILLHQEDG